LRPLWRFRLVGLGAELFFWWRWLGTRGLRWPEEFERRLDPQRPLLDHVAAYVRRIEAQPVRILDVGAGPVTCLGYRLEGKALEIAAVDVLARAYARLWPRDLPAPPVRTEYADAERLTDRFSPDSFDVVYAQNSLDHAAHPEVAIGQMLQVAKPGGYVVLMHARDEAVNEGYAGLHQWNFTERGGDFVVWNAARTINIAEMLRDSGAVRAELRGDSVFVEILKHKRA
jgi:SAM-dependent methyltransferase